MAKLQVVLVGAIIALGLPLLFGILLGRAYGVVTGLIGGGLLFLLIIMAAHFILRRKARQNNKQDE